jgi:hypothetical protein
MNSMKRIRKIASNQIVLEDKSVLTQSVVEISQGEVLKWYPLTQELPNTEWLGGQVCLIRDNDGVLRAYYNNKVIE